MQPRHHPEYEKDTTPSRLLIQQYRANYGEFSPGSDGADLSIVTYRGGEQELVLGREYCQSKDPLDRMVGAEILGQLGWGDSTFPVESVDTLIGLLADDEPGVISTAATALGHRSSERAVPALLKLMDHDEAEVRHGVVLGLSGIDNADAIDALIQLARDEDHEVRNWAVFGIGSQTTVDSLEIRDALWRAFRDDDAEIRGEALVGLAIRKDPGTTEAILEEWKTNDLSILSVEAAEEIADPALLPYLREFLDIVDADTTEYIRSRVQAAIEAARERQAQEDEMPTAPQ